MASRFASAAVSTPVPFGVGRAITAEQLPKFYAWAAAHLIPEFDRQLNIGTAAETLGFLTEIWPYDTGRSVNSWEAGINAAPEANGAPGPRPSSSRRAIADRLSGVRSGDQVIVANQARKPGVATSYASLLWGGSSRQMPRGAEKPLMRHLERSYDAIVKRAERIAEGGA